MMAQALAKFPMAWLSCIGLLLFLGVFIGALLWANRKGSGDIYKRMSEMPLDSEGESDYE
jgi:cbb3-type cytochrome oxidase subunit 3